MRRTQFGDEFSMMNHSIPRPQGHSYTFQSSTVTYGGSNGAYYSSSTTKRSGSDGVSNVKTFHERFSCISSVIFNSELCGISAEI